jgi:LPXTG-site transpeptidase (sortase) family protein
MKRRMMRRALSTLMLLGAIIALWPLGQTAYSQWNQRGLRAQWESATRKSTTAPPANTAQERPNAQPKIRQEKSAFPETRLVIPDAGADAVVLDGWDESTLRKAPGHLPGSADPGAPGNCVIAGHRNVYGSPFYRIDQLMAGAPIELRTPDAIYTYSVIKVFAATDSDQTVLWPPAEPAVKPRLTLITCTIPRTSNRIIVTAELQGDGGAGDTIAPA